jgi:hypothetical protein
VHCLQASKNGIISIWSRVAYELQSSEYQPSRNFFDAQTKIISTAIINVIQEWLLYTHLAHHCSIVILSKARMDGPEKIWIGISK